MNTLTSRSGRALAAWTLRGLAAYALLPWYFLQQQSLWAALPGVWGGDATASGVVQAALHGRPWLWTGLAGLLIAGAGLWLPVGRAQGGVLVGGALLGLAGLLASGFAIGAPGWSFPVLETTFGALERGQFGMGWGGFVAIALWREIRRLNEARMEDMKDANRAHSDLTKEVARTLDDLAENIRQARRE